MVPMMLLTPLLLNKPKIPTGVLNHQLVRQLETVLLEEDSRKRRKRKKKKRRMMDQSQVSAVTKTNATPPSMRSKLSAVLPDLVLDSLLPLPALPHSEQSLLRLSEDTVVSKALLNKLMG